MPKPDHVQCVPYHHGDLRRAVVVTALEILSETQISVPLRELARRAGVSHNAPYKHFADKRELLAAVSAVGFEQLTKRMSDKIAGSSNARAQMFAMLRAYIQHGVENPALYRSMFGGYLTAPIMPVPRSNGLRPKRQKPCSRASSWTAVSDALFRIPQETNARSMVLFWRAGLLAWSHSVAGRRACWPNEKVCRTG